MWFRSLLGTLLACSPRTRPQKRRLAPSFRRRSRSARPLLEILEDRTLLSTYVVDTLTDTGAGSGLTGDLRYCITKATSGSDTIAFAQGLTGTINVESALPALNASVAIQGPGANLLTVEPAGSAAFGFIFDPGSTATVEISGLTILGVITNSGTLTVSACNLGYGNFAGAVGNAGTLTVSACNLYTTSAACAITNSGTATVSDSDFAENVLVFGSGFASPIDNSTREH